MTRVLRFGQFFLSISGNQMLLDSLPSWEPGESGWERTSYSEKVLILKETSVFLPYDGNNGWNAISINGIEEVAYEVAYVEDQKVLFALRYNSSPDEVSVLIPSPARNAIRPGLQFGLLTALYQSCVGLHGVTLLCKDEIVILSAPSGTGKSTLAHMLETFCDALVINGDFAMLSLCEEGVVFEPTPFCGSSGRCLNHRVRIDRIVFLEQAKENCWQDLTGTAALVKLLSNSFVPAWDSTLQKSIQENLIRFLPHLRINRFAFAPVQEAAEMFYSKLISKQ